MRGIKNPFDDEGLDRLYRSTPRGLIRTHREIADAAGAKFQTIFYIEQQALKKIRAEFDRRRITPEVLP
jgi:hypothetical protein